MARGAALSYRILGPVEVVADDRAIDLGGAQRRAVLAQLIAAGQRVVSTDALTAGLWGDRPPPTATKSIQVHISKLRSVLPGDDLHTRAPGYLLDVAPGHTDVGAFQCAVEEGQAERTAGDLAAAISRWDDARALWRGEPLADVTEHPFVAPIAARLLALHDRLVDDHLEVMLELGRHREAVVEAEALVEADPRRERRWGLLMTALYRCGRQAEALEAFSRARRQLIDTSGIEPGPDLRRLEQAILAHDLPAPTPAPTPAAAAVPPLRSRGPDPFANRRRAVLNAPPRLVGRSRELSVLTEALLAAERGEVRAVAVRGDEGLGKSALVGAFARGVEGRADVVAGRCQPHTAVPYGPWIEIARQLESKPVLDLIEGGRREESYERTRVATLDEATAMVRVRAWERPLVVILDDLHWSDEATIDLLVHVVVELAGSPVLIVACWRDREIGVGHPVHRLIDVLDRNGGEGVDLGALGPDDLAQLFEASALPLEAEDARTLAVRVHDLTEGVPLFATEVVTTLAGAFAELPTGGIDAMGTEIPRTLASLVERRLRTAGTEARSLSEVCAVAGESTASDVVCELATRLDPPRSAESVLDDLDRLVDHGLLREVPGGHAFAHGSFRRCVLDTMRSGRRQQLHASAREVLVRRGAPPAEIAHHAEAAGTLTSRADLAEAFAAAGRDALGRGAFADARAFFERQTDLVEGSALAATWLAVGDAAGRAGDLGALKRASLLAIDEALAAGGPDEVLVAAGYSACIFGDGLGVDDDTLDAVSRAEAGATLPASRAALRTSTGYHLAMWGAPRQVVRDQLAAARAAAPSPLTQELEGHLCFAEGIAGLGYPDLAARAAGIARLEALDAGDPERPHFGRMIRLRCLAGLSAGRFDAVAADLDLLEDLAEATGSWLYRSDALRWRTAMAIASGDGDRVDELLDSQSALSSEPLAGRAFADTQRMLRAWLEVDPRVFAYLDPLTAALDGLDPCGTDRRLVDLIRLVALVEAGHHDEAIATYDAMVPARDLGAASCRRAPAEIALNAWLAARLDRLDDAAAIVAELVPAVGQLVVLSWGECLVGSFDGHLALLGSAIDGRCRDDAFAAAVALESRLGDHRGAARTRDSWTWARARFGSDR